MNQSINYYYQRPCFFKVEPTLSTPDTNSISVYPEVVRNFSSFHEDFVIVPTARAPNNYAFVLQIVGISNEKLCSSSSRHLLIRSGLHKVFALDGIKTVSISFTYSNIDHNILSMNNAVFDNYPDQTFLVNPEIKDTTESNTSASYIDLLLLIGRGGKLYTSNYDKRNDFNFHMLNCPWLSSNILSTSVYGIFISQLIPYFGVYSSYESFILKVTRFSNKLLRHG